MTKGRGSHRPKKKQKKKWKKERKKIHNGYKNVEL